MTNGEVGDLMYEVFVMAVQLAGPLLVISMLVGILIAIFQAATQIHEQTITFVPKLLEVRCFSRCRILQSGYSR